MLQHFAIRGRDKEDHLWRIFVVLKATSRKEAADLLQQYIVSHQRGCPWEAYGIDDIKAWEFGNHARTEGIRALVSKTATEYMESKAAMLAGAP